MQSITPPEMDCSSSTGSDHGIFDSGACSPISTAASTPQYQSLVDLPKLSRDVVATESTGYYQRQTAKNICCVGAGYVGKFDPPWFMV